MAVPFFFLLRSAAEESAAALAPAKRTSTAGSTSAQVAQEPSLQGGAIKPTVDPDELEPTLGEAAVTATVGNRDALLRMLGIVEPEAVSSYESWNRHIGSISEAFGIL